VRDTTGKDSENEQHGARYAKGSCLLLAFTDLAAPLPTTGYIGPQNIVLVFEMFRKMLGILDHDLTFLLPSMAKLCVSLRGYPSSLSGRC